ncbi:Tn3 family transposase [Actinoallomurus sp. NPDC052274]|uniref:Tn3 family transposase n=1 Tax=Actinoallomurus sp. NPDC052274 TaxID=3155420 RepID=UPI00341CFA7B
MRRRSGLRRICSAGTRIGWWPRGGRGRWPHIRRTSANTDLFYGSAGTIPGSDKEHQEVSMLSLHLLQSALVFINTLLVQSVLKDPAGQQRLTDADKRGLSPLFWSNANLYGSIDIDMERRLDIGLAA